MSKTGSKTIISSDRQNEEETNFRRLVVKELIRKRKLYELLKVHSNEGQPI